MSTIANLKTRNRWKLATFIVFNVAVFWTVLTTGALDIRSIADSLSGLDFRVGLFGLGLPVLVVLLSGVLSSSFKARLVFWRIRDPLPGSRAFVDSVQADPRIDFATLRARYGELPVHAAEQNRLWYRIFKKNENKPSVEGAHQNFLLTRDMTGLSFMFLVAFGGLVPVVAWGRGAIVYCILLMLEYLFIRRVASLAGVGLVRNVLAEETVS